MPTVISSVRDRAVEAGLRAEPTVVQAFSEDCVVASSPGG